MRILVIGTGSIGARHARVAHRTGRHELILADTRQDFLDELAGELSPLATVTDYRQAFELHPDAAIICTPNSLHADMAAACAQAGCHLLIEKPIAHTVQAARQILDVARQHERVALVGYVLRFWPGVAEIKQMLEDGAIGQPLSARVILGAYETLTYAKTNWRGASGAEGGPILDYSHEFDYLRWYLGDVDQVTAMTASIGPDAENLVTVAACVLRFSSGALGEVHMDYLQHPGRRELDIIGDEGRLFYDFRAMCLTVTDREGQTRRQTWNAERDDAFLAQLAAFEAACSGEYSAGVKAADGAATLATALACVRSSQTGRFEPVEAV